METKELDLFEDALVKFLTGLANGWQNGEDVGNLLGVLMQAPNAPTALSQWKSAWMEGNFETARAEAKEYIDYVFDFLQERQFKD